MTPEDRLLLKQAERLLPEGYAIVPIVPTENMLDELARIGDGPMISGAEVWGYMLSAATAAMASAQEG